MKKVTAITVEGKIYGVTGLSAYKLSQFVMDVEKADTVAVCRNYGVIEIT